MWDNPRMLNAAAGLLSALAMLLLLAAALRLLLRSPLFPLREIDVRGRLAHTSAAAIERAIAGSVHGNFFSVDLASLRAALQRLPWVRDVDVRRVWPDRLRVTIAERVPLARWGDAALIDTYGELIPVQADPALPLLAGPPGTEREVARRYVQFATMLAPLGSRLTRVILSPRYAWSLRLADGMDIELGRGRPRNPLAARLQRFVAVYPALLADLGRRIAYVDLRYPSGFAVRPVGSGHAPAASG